MFVRFYFRTFACSSPYYNENLTRLLQKHFQSNANPFSELLFLDNISTFHRRAVMYFRCDWEPYEINWFCILDHLWVNHSVISRLLHFRVHNIFPPFDNRIKTSIPLKPIPQLPTLTWNCLKIQYYGFYIAEIVWLKRHLHLHHKLSNNTHATLYS